MKTILTLCAGVLLFHFSIAQPCTTSGFNVCSNSTNVITDFRTPVLVSGNALSAGAIYKYPFATYTANSVAIDAYVTIDKLVNASLTTGVNNPTLDDDAVSDETGSTSSHMALLSPRIAPDVNLTCTNRRGYVQFTVRFYIHTSSNTVPPSNLEMGMETLDFIHFDMDGYAVGTNGSFREIGYVKKVGINNPVNYGSFNTELVNGGVISDADGEWLLTLGSTTERTGVSRCAEVLEKTSYKGAQKSVTFRFGYDYIAPVPCNGADAGRPTRQFGSKFGCYSLPNAAPLPVNISGISVAYDKGISTVNFTTEQEINVERFDIERSVNGSDFSKAGSLTARNLLSAQKYTFQDVSVPADVKIVYYRIRSVDRDHSSKLSKVVTVKIGLADGDISISPNPAIDQAQLKVQSFTSGIAEIKIYDMNGKEVLFQRATVQSGSNSIAINKVQSLQPGMYVLKYTSGNKNKSSKLVIRN